MCVNNLSPAVVTWQQTAQELNKQPLDCKSDELTTIPQAIPLEYARDYTHITKALLTDR